MGDNLNSLSQIVTTAFFVNNTFVNTSCCNVIGFSHFKYTGEFYGTNALDPDYVSRLFLSNYQKLAYVKGNEMVIMRPVRGVHFYRDGQQIGSAEAAKPRDRVKAPDASLQQVLDEGISYYQHSARWREFLKE